MQTLVMEGSEPSLVPEWLRTNAGDGTSSSLPKRNKGSSKNVSNSNGPSSSSFLDQSSLTSSRRSLCSNGYGNREKNSYSRSSYNYSSRNRPRTDRERFGVSDMWDCEDSDTLRGMKGGLRRCQSMIPRRPSELPRGRVFTDIRNGSHNNINGNGTNGTTFVHRVATGIQKVSLQGDFPFLGSDERPMTPDIVRVRSPGPSTRFQDRPIRTSSMAGCEGRKSVLTEVPMGRNGSSSSSVPYAAANATGPVSAPSAGASNGLNMAEALVKIPTSNSAPQLSVETQRMELPFMVSKRLIPVTASMSKNSVHNPSDKLKPKTASRPIDVGVGPKNGLQQTSFLQLGSQSGRSVSARGDGPNSSSTGKMLLLKPARENGVSPAMKDTPSQFINGAGMIANGPSIAAQSVASIPLKNPNKAKLSTNDRRTCAYGLNAVSLIDKRASVAQLQSRNDFFNLVRKRSLSGTSSDGSTVVVSSAGHNSDELKELASNPVTLNENGSDVKCDGDTCIVAENFSDCRESKDAGVYSNEEEKAFLRSLGWEENAGDDEGLTEEEINGFYQKYMEWIPASKLYRGLQLKIMTQPDRQSSCAVAASSS